MIGQTYALALAHSRTKWIRVLDYSEKRDGWFHCVNNLGQFMTVHPGYFEGLERLS